MEHAMRCFARLVRILLGSDAVNDAKVACGRRLCVLGVSIAMASHGFQCHPDEEKVKRWLLVIEEALQSGRLSAGLASKLAGKLSWGCAALFHRVGRAMIRPVYDQKSR